jgi:predicted dienelactone hydrolase
MKQPMPATTPGLKPRTTFRRLLPDRWYWLAFGLLGLGALCLPAASPALAAPTTKPEALAATTPEALAVDRSLYSSQTFDWYDTTRDRSVPAKLYLPVGPLKPGTLPLVVFSHGIGGSRDGYSYLGSYFAANGYASLHVQHIGSDRQLWLGSPWSLVFRLTEAAQETEALNRVKDMKFALSRLLADPLGSSIDTQRLVAAGHSYGANTSMLLAGAQVRQTPYATKDTRFSAAILISAPPFYGFSDPQNIVSSIDVPTLHITATADDIQIPGYNSGMADRLALYQATGQSSRAAKVLAVFKDGSHSIFTDRMGTGGIALNPKVKVATRQLVLAFLNTLHAKDLLALEKWSGQHADIVARFERAAL